MQEFYDSSILFIRVKAYLHKQFLSSYRMQITVVQQRYNGGEKQAQLFFPRFS